MSLEDDLQTATAALAGSALVPIGCGHRSVGAATGCGGRSIAGTNPPRCRVHGGLGAVSAVAAAVRLEAARAAVVDRLSEAVELAVDTYVAVLKADYWLPGSERMVTRVVGRGDSAREIEVEIGTEVTARDKLKAAELVLALAGANAETLNNGSQAVQDALGGPQGALLAVLDQLPPDAMERLARRLGAIEATAV